MAADAATSGTSLVSVGNSALYVSGNSEYLSRTPGSAGNRDTWTFSAWVNTASRANGQTLFSAGSNDSNGTTLWSYSTNGALQYRHRDGGSNTDNIITTPLFRDIGWYHIVFAVDTTQAVETNRVRIYVNGVAITDFSTSNYPAQNADTDVNSTVAHHVGATTAVATEVDGYIAETVLIDGLQLTPTSFGEFDSTGLYWTPKSSAEIKALTFGTNGFYLDNTTNAETDASGNGNNYTNNNTVVTTTHTPTNSHCLLNPLVKSGQTLSIGNTKFTGAANHDATMCTLPSPYGTPTYFECTIATTTSSSVAIGIGLCTIEAVLTVFTYSQSNFWNYFISNGDESLSTDGSRVATGANTTLSAGAVIQVARNGDKLWIGINNTWFNASGGTDGDPSAGTNPSMTISGSSALELFPVVNYYSGNATLAFEEADWAYSPPTNFNALNTTTIAAATTRTASDTTKYFDTILYEGNGDGQRVGQFQPFDNAFTVGNGALFNGDDNYLSRTQTAGSNTVWTFSAWIKKCENKNTVYLDFGTGSAQLGWNASGQFYIYNGATVVGLTTQIWEDASQWNHFHLAYNTGASGTDKCKLTVNGVLITTWSTDNRSTAGAFTDANQSSKVVVLGNNGNYGADAISLNGYTAECVMLDGTASAASNFGQTDTSTNRWIPKDVSGLDYTGANSFYLQFGSSGANLGDDDSGAGNNLANTNSAVQVTDSPTTNLAVLDANFTNATLLNGNRTSDAGSGNCTTRVTIPMITGKFYWEGGADAQDSANATPRMGIGNLEQAKNVDMGNAAQTTWAYNMSTNSTYYGKTIFNTTQTGSAVSFTTSQVAQFAYDADAGKFWVGKDNTWLFSGNPATGANPTYEGIVGPIFPCVQDTGTSKSTIAIAEADWTYSAPTDFVALSQDAMTSTDQFISAFSWIKNRDATDNHMLFDRVRGVTNDIHSNTTAAQVTNLETVQSFLAGGVQVGNDVEVNTASESYVLWNWMFENTGSGASNTDGTINTTSTLVDTTLGMSISTYTGTGANATIGHGLGVAPAFIIIKDLDAAVSWVVGSDGIGWTKYLHLDLTNAAATGSFAWNDTAPTSTTISLGSWGNLNTSGRDYVAYCFAPSQFISIGSYEGNSNADGPFIPTLNSLGVPIQPVFWMHKCVDTAYGWYILDNVQQTYNVLGPQVLSPDTTEAVPSTTANYREADFVTGGVKIRASGDQINNSNTHLTFAIGIPLIDTDGRILPEF